MKKTISIMFTIAIFTVLFTCNTAAEEIETTNHEIKITTNNQFLSVKESLTILEGSDEFYEKILLWIPTGAQDINILFNSNPPTSYNFAGNTYTYNLTGLNVSMNQSMLVSLSYNLDKNIVEFQKTMIYDTKQISVSFDDDENKLYSAENLFADSSFTIRLYKPTEAPLSLFTIAFIILLVILLVVITLYSFKKQKTPKVRITGIESEELLSTKKTLLMTLLKDIEKQHRAQKISDDTYHKLKEQYKQDTVDSMKKLEDMKSKVK